ncbi:MAG: hypothetical protein ACRC2R_27620 [Xenococcaceae cyanobacterium]
MQNLLNRTVRLLALVSFPVGLFAATIPSRPAIASSFDSCLRELQGKNISGEQASIACAEAFEPDTLSTCTERISAKGSIPAEDALKACFRVRRPLDLASCVTNIQDKATKTYATKPTEEPSGTQNKSLSKDSEKIFSQAPTEPTAPAPTTPTLEPAQPEEAPTTPAPTQPEAAPTETPQPTNETSATSEASGALALETCRRSLLPVRFSECVIAVNNNVQGTSPDDAMKTCIRAEDYPSELYPSSSAQ